MDVDEDAEKLPLFPQIIVLKHCQQQQYFIVVEKNVLLESDGIEGSLTGVYFTFDISYPKKLYPVLYTTHLVEHCIRAKSSKQCYNTSFILSVDS